MSVRHREEPRPGGTSVDRGALALSGVLLLGGFVVNAIQRRLLHPTGAEDDHEAIFTEYAASDAWVATHLAEFVLILVALAGLLVLCGALRPEMPYLAVLAAGAIIATGAIWAVLQAVDGLTLKQAVDAWVAASETEKTSHDRKCQVLIFWPASDEQRRDSSDFDGVPVLAAVKPGRHRAVGV
ncbi:MAG TPA: hypothetical protein VF086_09530, partial [Propionibacteriaceae bacterium]